MPTHPQDWLTQVRDHQLLEETLAWLGLPARLAEWDGQGEIKWLELWPRPQPLQPAHFEAAQGKPEREAYLKRSLRKALDSGKPLQGSSQGFDDYFFPLSRPGQSGAALCFGQFTRQAPDFAALLESWRRVAGARASQEDPDFSRFLSSALSLSLLVPSALKGLQEFAPLLAAYIKGESSKASLQPKLERLRLNLLAPHLPHPSWAAQALGVGAPRPAPWRADKSLELRDKEGLGLTRLPTVVLAAAPLHADPFKARILARVFFHEAWAWGRGQGDMLAERLGEEGILILCSPDPRRSAGLAKREMKHKAEALRDFAHKRLGLQLRMGLGGQVPEGERLLSSRREAVLALHYAFQTERELLFFEEMPRERGGFQYPQLARAASELTAVFEQGVDEPLKLAMDEYVRLTLEFSGEKLEPARGQFLATISRLIEVLRRRYTRREGEMLALSGELSALLEAAPSMADLIQRFKEALKRFSFLAVAGSEGSRFIRLESTLAWMRENLAQPISLPDAARRAALSVPGFTRAFRKATGSPFLSYLRSLRVEQAKRLLRGSSISVQEVAPLCGFSSPHHLIRAFKQVTGLSPLAFRKKSSKASGAAGMA